LEVLLEFHDGSQSAGGGVEGIRRHGGVSEGWQTGFDDEELPIISECCGERTETESNCQRAI